MPTATHRVSLAPAVLRWAIDYSRREEYLRRKYPKLSDWESGRARPTVKQLGQFAKDARVAEGWLNCSKPPVLKPEIPDMRTVGDEPITDPSPDLIDTIFDCQIRQDWFAGFAEAGGRAELEFVGSFRVSDSPIEAAREMRSVLGISVDHPVSATRREYRKALVDKIELAGVLVMINGVVGNDTHRKLNISEFRGFALSDPLAPVIFINARDSLGGQLFTLAHELAHLWLGESAISAPDDSAEPNHASELWCNAAAAEFLVPLQEMRKVLGDRDPIESLEQLGRHFKVSDQVILRRLDTAGAIDREMFRREYGRAVARARRSTAKASGGGNFYATLMKRVSRTFAESLYLDTEYGGTRHTEAFRMLGLKDVSTFNQLGIRMGIEI